MNWDRGCMGVGFRGYPATGGVEPINFVRILLAFLIMLRQKAHMLAGTRVIVTHFTSVFATICNRVGPKPSHARYCRQPVAGYRKVLVTREYPLDVLSSKRASLTRLVRSRILIIQQGEEKENAPHGLVTTKVNITRYVFNEQKLSHSLHFKYIRSLFIRHARYIVRYGQVCISI